MSMDTVDLHGVRASAHKLYCLCENLPTLCRPLSKSVRKLRNQLEEVQDALSENEGTIQPEQIHVLRIVNESRDVLAELENHLRDPRFQTLRDSHALGDFMVTLQLPLEAITARMTEALNALEQQSDHLDSRVASSHFEQLLRSVSDSPTTPAASSEYGQWESTASSVRSFSPSTTSILSAHSDTMEPRLRRLQFLMEQMSRNAEPEKRRRQSEMPLSTTRDWRIPFEVPDPMSSDIDNASSLILRSDSRRPRLSTTTGAHHMEYRPIFQYAQYEPAPDRDNGGALGRSPELGNRHSFNPPLVQQTTGPLRLSETLSMVRAAVPRPRPTHIDAKTADDVQMDRAPRHPEPLSSGTTGPGFNGAKSSNTSGQHNSAATGPRRSFQDRGLPYDAKASRDERTNGLTALDQTSSQLDIHRNLPTAASITSGVSAESVPLPRSTKPKVPLKRLDLAQQVGSFSQPSDTKPRYKVVNPDRDAAAPGMVDQKFDGAVIQSDDQLNSDLPPIDVCKATLIGTTDMAPRFAEEDKILVSSEMDGPYAQGTEARCLEGSPLTGEDHQPSQTSHRPTQVPLNIGNETDFLRTNSEMTGKLDDTKVGRVIQNCNAGRWDESKAQISSLLDSLQGSHMSASARKLRHLLAVIASIQGEWQKALPLFISVLNRPITEAARLDPGDCAAAYWLGDAYAILNRRVEALLAYSLAERGSLSRDSPTHALHEVICADQQLCILNFSSFDFDLQWNRLVQNVDRSAADSVLDPGVVETSAAKLFLHYVLRQSKKVVAKSAMTNASQSRAMLTTASTGMDRQHGFELSHANFEANGPWPISFDPYFAMTNVSHGRLVMHECDLLHKLSADSAFEIPKTGPRGRGGMNLFTCQDLKWLIVTLRACLTRLGTQCCEATSQDGTYLFVRYAASESNIATHHYFTISVFRLNFRPGYGVDICPGGISSARIVRADGAAANLDKGVHKDDTKRMKKYIREYLDAAALREDTAKLKNTALPVMGVNGASSLQRRVSTTASRQPGGMRTSISQSSVTSSGRASVSTRAS